MRPSSSRRGEGGAVHQRAAAGVDQQRLRLHQRQPPGIDQTLRLRRQRAVQAQHVGAPEELVDAAELHLEAIERRGVRAVRVAGEDRHAQRRADARERAADAPQPDNGERAAGQLGDRRHREAPLATAAPGALAHRLGVRRGAARELQHQRRGVLRHGSPCRRPARWSRRRRGSPPRPRRRRRSRWRARRCRRGPGAAGSSPRGGASCS